MGPLDYTMDVANPLQMALQGYQFGAQMRAQQQAQQAAQAKAEAMASLMKPGVTFGDYQRTMQAFPDEAKSLLEQWKSMNEVQQGALFNSAGEAYSLLQPGADGKIDPARAVAKLEEYAVASENSGDKDTAQKLRDMAGVVRANPMAGRATIGVNMAMIDGERFKAIAGAELGNIDTAAVKNLIAEGLKPGTPEFQSAMRAEREKVTVTLPGGGFFSGSPERLNQIMGGIPANVQRGSIPRPRDKAEFDALPPGSAFYDPNGVIRTKPGNQGGPTPSASGGFR